MSLDKLKLNKQLLTAMIDAGYLTAKEVQLKTMSRMLGGQDLVVTAAEGSGKTTAYVLATIMRLKYAFEEAPRALILVPDKDAVDAVLAKFELLDKQKGLRILGIYNGVALETQLNLLTDGVDVVVATPDRARTVYLKLGLNLNKIQTFIIDDAAAIVKQGLQLPVAELARSMVKCQHLVFTDVMHQRVSNMIEPFLHFPAYIEIEDVEEPRFEIHQQTLYHLPNFRTKINLLNLLISLRGENEKMVVYVNTRLNAERIFKSINLQPGEIALLKPVYYDTPGLDNVEDFKEIKEIRVLIVANELGEDVDLDGVNVQLHFELPETKEFLINRIVKTSEKNIETASVIFVTDAELSDLKRVEQAIGRKLDTSELPAGLLIEKEQKKKDNPAKLKADDKADDQNGAFHEKKASNNKDYNYSSREKAKMSGKIRSRRKN